MTFSTHPVASTGPNSLSQRLWGFLQALMRGGRAVLGFGHSVLRALQTGRMMSTLTNMSDDQLAQIGITRADIPRYALKLMEEE